MKISFRSIVCALGCALATTTVRADYMPPETQLARLESIVDLTAAQKRAALRIFQDLTDIMNSLSPTERPVKGAQSRQDARAAIRALLSPSQQRIYDATPQSQGGGSKEGDPLIRAAGARI